MAVTQLMTHFHVQEASNVSSDFLVIGVGLPRTGTSSMRLALVQLFGGSCYHMINIFHGDKVDWDHWQKALDDLDKEEKSISDQV
jgi:hypothetical protein